LNNSGRLLVVGPTSQKIVDRCADCTTKPEAAHPHDAIDEKQSCYRVTPLFRGAYLGALSVGRPRPHMPVGLVGDVRALVAVNPGARFLRHRIATWPIICGQHSLIVFWDRSRPQLPGRGTCHYAGYGESYGPHLGGGRLFGVGGNRVSVQAVSSSGAGGAGQ
jgi:hypothetical protein